MIVSQDGLLQAAKLSLYTPFKVKAEYSNIDENQSVEMLKQASDAAVNLL